MTERGRHWKLLGVVSFPTRCMVISDPARGASDGIEIDTGFEDGAIWICVATDGDLDAAIVTRVGSDPANSRTAALVGYVSVDAGMLQVCDKSVVDQDSSAVEPIVSFGGEAGARWYRMCVARLIGAKAALIPHGAVFALWSDGDYEVSQWCTDAVLDGVAIEMGIRTTQ